MVQILSSPITIMAEKRMSVKFTEQCVDIPQEVKDKRAECRDIL